jgi:hypothetical protein
MSSALPFLYSPSRYADLGGEVLGRRVTASVVRGNVDEAVDVVLGNSIGNTFDTVDVDVLVGEVPGVVRNHIFMRITHGNSLGGILATDKVVDDIGVTNALLDGLSVAQVVFLCRGQALSTIQTEYATARFHTMKTTRPRSPVTFKCLLAISSR